MKKKLTHEEIDGLMMEDWRELGFFYDHDKDARCWRLIGSRSGLLRFCAILNEYVANERKASLSEHEHYGPYWYLKIVTWDEPVIAERSIRGTFEDLQRLSELAKHKLENAKPGDVFEIDKEYSPNNEFKLRFEVREDGFDPVEADPLLPSEKIIDNQPLLSRIWHKLRSG